MTLKEQEELMLKPVWTFKEVMTYCGVKKSKAYQIIKHCKDVFHGKVMFREDEVVVKRDSVLAFCGSSIEHERYVAQQMRKAIEEAKTD